MRHVIIGGSIAASSAIAAIREKDPKAGITVVTPEESPFYYRPLIPMLLEGTRSMDELSYQGRTGELGMELVRDRADGLDAAARRVRLASGGMIEYDRLLVATGSAPVMPEVPGDMKLYPLRSATDALALKKAAEGLSGLGAVVIGGGLVGVKTSLALKSLGLKPVIVEKMGQLLYPRLDPEGASLVEDRLVSAGVGIVKDDEVAEAVGGKVILKGGSEIPAGLVAVATGTTPAVGWLGDSGLKAGDGLVVDGNLMTSAQGVYAAGDAVEFQDAATGRTFPSALWTNAASMGKVAGANMAGEQASYSGMLRVMNATEIEGMPMVSMGEVDADAEVHVRTGAFGYRKLLFDGQRLLGAIFMGEINGSGVYTHLLRNRAELSVYQKERALSGSLGYADFVLAGTV
jgi:NAD(P)H-nitrite reductase large subunit